MIKMLGGLAMINVLTDSLKICYSARFKTGAVFSFLITISGILLFHIGAPFWGLVGGTLAEKNRSNSWPVFTCSYIVIYLLE
ncbi:benzoate/H(+) symporter BenE family transporter [Neobacillus sp. BF23-41]|uniref:benzoate/H(+) symporter BenE family transporter n=1 Tax=Neobacillus sp. BF23-41 TaxID=3240280 RepID=UPI0034E4351F